MKNFLKKYANLKIQKKYDKNENINNLGIIENYNIVNAEGSNYNYNIKNDDNNNPINENKNDNDSFFLTKKVFI